MKNRSPIRRRSRIFLGCEGESEQSYGAFLQRLADERGLMVHILSANLRPAGDPLALAEKASRAFNSEEKKVGFSGKAIILDSDRLADAPERGRRAIDLLTRERFTTIWQEPDHEGFLLRHFPGRSTHNPPRGRSLQALQEVWPEYHKNMTAADLKKKFTLQDVARAADVIPELKHLLINIGLL